MVTGQQGNVRYTVLGQHLHRVARALANFVGHTEETNGLPAGGDDHGGAARSGQGFGGLANVTAAELELVDEARTSDDNLLRPNTSLRAETRQRDNGLRGGDRQVICGCALDNRAADRMLGSTLERRRQRQNLVGVERH